MLSSWKLCIMSAVWSEELECRAGTEGIIQIPLKLLGRRLLWAIIISSGKKLIAAVCCNGRRCS